MSTLVTPLNGLVMSHSSPNEVGAACRLATNDDHKADARQHHPLGEKRTPRLTAEPDAMSEGDADPQFAGPLLTGPPRAPSAFHVMAKPTGAVCNLDCEYCFFLS